MLETEYDFLDCSGVLAHHCAQKHLVWIAKSSRIFNERFAPYHYALAWKAGLTGAIRAHHDSHTSYAQRVFNLYNDTTFNPPKNDWLF